MNAIDYILEGHQNARTRKQLTEMTGMTDRAVREDLRLASIHGDDLIINVHDGKGYFRPIPNKEDHLVRYYISLNESMTKELERRTRMAKRYLG